MGVDLAGLLWILSAVLILAGLAGLVLPALPGAPLLFLGLVAAAWAEGFVYVGWGTLLLLGVLAVLTYAVDFAAGAFGAKRFGASGRAVAGAALGTLFGLWFGLAGVLLGPFIGAVTGELTLRRDLRSAGRAGIGATLGLALGAAAKIALAFTMLGTFLAVRLIDLS
jgi:uncharacterized protein YqgC (DUF456 family)